MGFLKPKVPKPDPAPNPAITPIQANDGLDSSNPYSGPASLITTSSSGLRRRAQTQRTSLIGGM